jgi:acyl dehydratase
MIVGIAFGLAAPLLSYSVVALLDMSWTFKRAVWPGDTVTALVRITDRAPSRRPDRGVITLALDILNQRREVVQTATAKVLVHRTPSQDAT